MINQIHGNISQNNQMVANKPFSYLQIRKPRRIGFGSEKYMEKMADLLERAEELFTNAHSCYSNKANLVKTINERNLTIIRKLKDNIYDLNNTWNIDKTRREKFSVLRKHFRNRQIINECFVTIPKTDSYTESCSQVESVMDTTMLSQVQGTPTTLEFEANTFEKSKSSEYASDELDRLISKIRNQYCDSDSSTHSSSSQTLRDEDYYEKKIDELFPQSYVTNEDYDLSNKVAPNDLTSVMMRDVMLNKVTGLLEPVTDQEITSANKENKLEKSEFRTVVVSTPNNCSKTNNTLFGFGQNGSGLVLNYVFDKTQQKWIISH